MAQKNMVDLHICVFPLDDYSVILLFMKDGSKKLRRFYKALNNLTTEEQLQAISYIAFLYSEEVFISKTLEKIVKDNDMVKNIAGTTTIFNKPQYDKEKILDAAKMFGLSNYINFPNLLSKDFAING